ncbi:MAG: alpha/beta fold hydrolase [Candidatus Marinimicrobia bacterium]|nr:alpha/beta fold hydrolase [Candidatus Neomarinimicrobiota bacterium]
MNLSFRKYGQGPPLLILHGLFGSADNWHSLAKRWGQSYTVYALDLRNHGSSPHESAMDYLEMVQDLSHFCHQEELKQVNIVGHSLGGRVAMLFATLHPQIINSLSIIDIGMGPVKRRHEPILGVLRTLDLADFSDRGLLDSELNKSIESGPIRHLVQKNVLRSVEGSFGWKFNHEALLDHYEDLTAPLELNDPFIGSVLFLRGEYSDYLDEQLSPEILRYFPLARLKTIPGAGHWVHADQPELVYEAINNFLT